MQLLLNKSLYSIHERLITQAGHCRRSRPHTVNSSWLNLKDDSQNGLAYEGKNRRSEKSGNRRSGCL